MSRDTAIEAQNTVDKSPESIISRAKAFYRSGKAKMGNKEYEEAILDFERVIALKSNFTRVSIFIKLASCKMHLRRYENAILDLNQGILLQPDAFDAFVNRGRCHTQLKNYSLAVADFRETLRLKPNNELVIKYLDSALAKLEIENSKGNAEAAAVPAAQVDPVAPTTPEKRVVADPANIVVLPPVSESEEEVPVVPAAQGDPVAPTTPVADPANIVVLSTVRDPEGKVPVVVAAGVVTEKQSRTQSNNAFTPHEFKISYSKIALAAALGAVVLGVVIMAISAASLAASFGASSFLSVGGVLLGKHIAAYGVCLLLGVAITAGGANALRSQQKTRTRSKESGNKDVRDDVAKDSQSPSLLFPVVEPVVKEVAPPQIHSFANID